MSNSAQIWPKARSTMPTLMHATCSTVCLRGRHAPSALRHGRRASHLSAARLLVPCSSITRARVPHAFPHSLCRSLPHAAARAQRQSRHGRLAERAATASLLPWAPSCSLACATGSANLSSFSCAPSSSPPRPGGRRTTPATAACRRRAWPVKHGPSPGHPWQPLGANGPPGASPPFPRHHRPFSGRHRPIPRRPLFQPHVEDLGLKFE